MQFATRHCLSLSEAKREKSLAVDMNFHPQSPSIFALLSAMRKSAVSMMSINNRALSHCCYKV
jgi:hypothetical protein